MSVAVPQENTPAIGHNEAIREEHSHLPSAVGSSSVGASNTASDPSIPSDHHHHHTHTDNAAAINDPEIQAALKEEKKGKIEVAVGKVLHASGLVAKGEALIQHAHVVKEEHGLPADATKATLAGATHGHNGHNGHDGALTDRENLAETPELAGGLDPPPHSEGTPNALPQPAVGGPGAVSGLQGGLAFDMRNTRM